MSLEEGAHLRVSAAGAVEDEEVELERESVDAERDNDQAQDSGDPVLDVDTLPSRKAR